MCRGLVPQHPPITLAPESIAFLHSRRNSSSDAYSLIIPSGEGSPFPKLG